MISRGNVIGAKELIKDYAVGSNRKKTAENRQGVKSPSYISPGFRDVMSRLIDNPAFAVMMKIVLGGPDAIP